MIVSFFFHNFKSFIKTELDIAALTLLIGSNASGKTNAIEGLRILSETAAGHPLSVIMDGSRNTAGVIRGGSIGCPRMPLDTFELGCTLKKDSYTLTYRIEISVQKGNVWIESESLTREYKEYSEKVFETIAKADNKINVKCLSDKYDDFAKNGQFNRNTSVLTQIINWIPTDSKVLVQGLHDSEDVVKALANIFFFQPETDAMRDYVRISDGRLRPDGANISAVLYGLCQDLESHPEYKQEIISIVHGLPDNEIEDIVFVKTELNDVIFALKEKYNAYPMDAKRLSDGTLSCLAMASLVYSEPENSIIIMEEMDNGIHPSRVKRLFQALSEVAERRHLTLIITTHNPALMDAINPDNIEGVVICYRNGEDGGSCFLRLVDFPEYFRLASKGHIGELATKDEFVKSIRRPKEDVRKFYEWLESGTDENGLFH